MAPAHPSLLVCPGWNDHGKPQYERLRAVLEPRGWHCRRAGIPDADWDRGERKSESRADSLAQLLKDYDALAETPGTDAAAIGVLGFSYGAYEAAMLTASRSPAWLALRSPALYPDEDWTQPKEELDSDALQRYRRLRIRPGENRALACCAAFRGDVLLIESGCDEVIPREVIENYAEAFGNARSLTRRVLPGADHELSAEQHRAAYHALAVSWLAERWSERRFGMRAGDTRAA